MLTHCWLPSVKKCLDGSSGGWCHLGLDPCHLRLSFNTTSPSGEGTLTCLEAPAWLVGERCVAAAWLVGERCVAVEVVQPGQDTGQGGRVLLRAAHPDTRVWAANQQEEHHQGRLLRRFFRLGCRGRGQGVADHSVGALRLGHVHSQSRPRLVRHRGRLCIPS